VEDWVMSVREGARYAKIHIRHVLISAKFRHPATPFPRRCRIKHFCCNSIHLPSHSSGSQLLRLMLLVVPFPVVVISSVIPSVIPSSSPSCFCSLAHCSQTQIHSPFSVPWNLCSQRCLTSFKLPYVVFTFPCAPEVIL
jgi:hypothetical protein